MYSLNCSANELETIDVTPYPYLHSLILHDNNLTTIDVSANPNLEILAFDNNQVEQIDLLFSANLKVLTCNNNPVSELDLSGNPQLMSVSCVSTNLTTLDLSQQSELSSLDVSETNLVSLFVKNGRYESIVFYDNPLLEYICADEQQVADVQQWAGSADMEVEVNSYCSFVPGGEFFTISGISTLDNNNNGCDSADLPAAGLQFSIDGESTTGVVIANTDSFATNLQAGTYSVTPILENPQYFTVSPSSFSVTFPGQQSPAAQNFCLSPTGIHNDVEVLLLPTTAARPGFDADYTVVIRNKGTEVSSGKLSLDIPGNVLDLVEATPVSDMQSENNLTWNYSNMSPFESRAFNIRLNLNSPTETPALQGGETIAFNATLITQAADELPLDNTSNLQQVVVNSLDPNDKTCLEGDLVGLEMVGQYVHYIIRFENTGSADAVNVVIRDEIDVDKFDISTMIPLHASHDFRTAINGNKVEFIFEDIMLPFAPSELRHGYVAFKIKLLNNLAVGDTFSNQAGIYFDYNFPVETNNATTAIQTLGNPNLAINEVSIYPNPASSSVTIISQSTVTKAEVVDLYGRTVKIMSPNNNTVNIEDLPQGTYILKVSTVDGIKNLKLIKN